MLRLGASVGAMMAALLALHEQRRPAPSREPSPRRRSRKPIRKIASAERAKTRERARDTYFKALRKQREIGVNPKYAGHRSLRSKTRVAAWERASREWDRANAGATR